MCIICNMSKMEDVQVASDFLSAFSNASAAMQRSADLMLECSKRVGDAADRARYDAVHKKMVRQIADWNRLEHEREAGSGKEHISSRP